MEQFIAAQDSKVDCCPNPDTWIYPTLQMGSFGIDQEYQSMKSLFLSRDPEARLYISTAYFNPLQEYVDLITRQSESEYCLLTASPQVRKRAIPSSYVNMHACYYAMRYNMGVMCVCTLRFQCILSIFKF